MLSRQTARAVTTFSLVSVTLAAMLLASAGSAAGDARVTLTLVSSITGTTAMAAREGDDALYLTEQIGRVRALRDRRLLRRVVLDITDDVSAGGERGLLGLAFSPDGTKLYVNYTDTQGDTRVDEFGMRRRVADVSTRREVLSVDQPQPNHNGGQLAFGPDGYLYIGLGDGGGGGDTGPGHVSGGNAQSLTTLLGKILRIDPAPSGGQPYTVPPDNPFVGRPGARPEIWAYGLRNPWRFSFDAESGDLWIGDVGQSGREEVNHAPARQGRDAGRGDNYGWNRLEGTRPFRGDAPAGSVLPVHEYETGAGGCAVTGGYVYRGTAITRLRGKYVFGDYCEPGLRTLELVQHGPARVRSLGAELPSVASFGEGPDHELYVLSQSRGVFRLDPRPTRGASRG